MCIRKRKFFKEKQSKILVTTFEWYQTARIIIPTAWLVQALALTQSQVAAWKNYDELLSKRAYEALDTHLFHPGHDARKDITAEDVDHTVAHYYDEECNCILDGLVYTNGRLPQAFHMRLPFQWINFLHNLEAES